MTAVSLVHQKRLGSGSEPTLKKIIIKSEINEPGGNVKRRKHGVHQASLFEHTVCNTLYITNICELKYTCIKAGIKRGGEAGGKGLGKG